MDERENPGVGCYLCGHSDTLPQGTRGKRAAAVADDAEHRKRVKYTHLESTHYFISVAIETLGAMGQEARSFFKEVSHRIITITNEPQTLQFPQQRVAVAVQRGNAASILGSAVGGDGSLIFS